MRTDGGSPEQCTGLVDAPYPGSGTNQPCAWDHPFRALPPKGTPRIQGGDTLIIGAGSYMMGYGAPGATTCESDSPWECYMSPIPSGPCPAHPTRILGAGWDSGCSKPPELWGTERADMIINLTDSSNVVVRSAITGGRPALPPIIGERRARSEWTPITWTHAPPSRVSSCRVLRSEPRRSAGDDREDHPWVTLSLQPPGVTFTEVS